MEQICCKTKRSRMNCGGWIRFVGRCEIHSRTLQWIVLPQNLWSAAHGESSPKSASTSRLNKMMITSPGNNTLGITAQSNRSKNGIGPYPGILTGAESRSSTSRQFWLKSSGWMNVSLRGWCHYEFCGYVSPSFVRFYSFRGWWEAAT